MSNDTDVMRAVLAGQAPGREAFEAYYRAFHEEHLRATETMLAKFADEQSRGTYDRLADAVALNPRASALDVGCGDGALLERLIARRPDIRVSGVDLSPAEIYRAADRLPAVNVNDLAVAAAEELPFSDDSFDAVVSHMVIMLVPDAARAVGEVRRVLRSGGAFAFLIPRPSDSDAPIAQLLRALPQWVRELHPAFAPMNPGDARVFSIDGLTKILNENGFRFVEFDDFTVSCSVSSKELRELLRQRYYIGSLPPGTRAHVDKRVDAWLDGKEFTYIEAMRIVKAR